MRAATGSHRSRGIVLPGNAAPVRGSRTRTTAESGTNATRGTAHEFLRHDVFDARDAFDYFDRTGDGKADPTRSSRTSSDSPWAGRCGRIALFISAAWKSPAFTVPTIAWTRYLQHSNGKAFSTRLSFSCATPSPAQRFRVTRSPATMEPGCRPHARPRPGPNFSGTTRANYAASPRQQATARPVPCPRRSQVLEPRPDARPRQLDGLRGGAKSHPFRRRPWAAVAMISRVTTTIAFNVALSETHVFGSSAASTKCAWVSTACGRTSSHWARGSPNQDFGLRVDASEAVEGLARLNFPRYATYAPLGELPVQSE